MPSWWNFCGQIRCRNCPVSAQRRKQSGGFGIVPAPASRSRQQQVGIRAHHPGPTGWAVHLRECLGGTPCRFGRRNFKHSAVIAGPSKLHAADLVIPDLRAGFSHLIAALAAEGTSRVYGVDLINRGYEDFEAKLADLGAHAERP